MANGDIKQKIVLDGEKEYRQALKDAQRELKTLRSELKAETAELGKNATEQEKNAVKVKNLQRQIQEQEKIVKTYTKALEEVKEKYGDNQDEIAKWEIKLNDARTALANMKSGLDSASQGLQKVSNDAKMGVVAADSFANAFEGIGKIGESISGTVEGIFGDIISATKQAIGELWGLITDTAAKANNWTDLANYFGSTAEQMQLMDRAISASAGDFSKFTNLVTQLSFGGKNKKISEWFGVSDANYTNNVEYTMAVLDAMSKAYKEWGTGGKWDNAMTEIFGGKKSADVSWFVTNYDTIIGKQKELQDNGFLMDSDTLSVMNDVHVELNTIEEKWDALKAKFAGGFGSTTLEIATSVSGALDALAKYFNAETPQEREEALQDLRTNIEEAFKALAAAISEGIKALNEVAAELQESEDPIVRTIGSILGGLGKALEWLTEDNANNAKNALLILAGVWTGSKVLKMISNIGTLAAHIATIKAANGLGGLSGLLSSGTGAAASASSAAGTAAGGAGLIGIIKSGIIAAAPALAGVFSVAAVSAGMWFGLEKGYREREWGEFQQNEILNQAMGEEPEILQKLKMGAAWRDDENGEIYDWTEFFRENANEFMKLTPDSDLWAKMANFADLSDGLQDSELDDILEHMFDYGIFGEDFTEMMKDLYNILSREYQEGGMTDLPADWWKKDADENGVTSEDLASLNELPAATKAAVKELVGSVVFKMDSEIVARLVAPEVSTIVAEDIKNW